MTALVITALAVYILTDAIKTIVRWPLQPLTKLGIATILSFAISPFLVEGIHQTIITASAAVGLAALTHRAHRFFGALGDNARSDVVLKAGRRIR